VRGCLPSYKSIPAPKVEKPTVGPAKAHNRLEVGPQASAMH
jgi:hypothetical protein